MTRVRSDVGTLNVTKIDRHRNGIAGNGFDVVLFKWRDVDDAKTRNMMAVLFEERGNCAVLDVDETTKGNVEFAAGNSWRGDHFEDALREAIDQSYAATKPGQKYVMQAGKPAYGQRNV